MKFICDDMLGRLAKWLRILGFDTLYFNSISNPELLRICLKDRRILITKDRHIPGRYMLPKYIIIKEDDYLLQLKQVYKELDIKNERINVFSRCLECNNIIEPIEKKYVQDRVPPHVYEINSSFYICKSCKKIFWNGTHRDNTIKKLKGQGLI